jgi:ABC-2 type transport system ATP-binding protein
MSETTATRPLASLRGARKHFGKIRALDGLDLSVRRGELLAVLGPNGAGKSTAISLLLGLENPDAGTAELFGLDPRDLEARRRVGIMMQEVALSPVQKRQVQFGMAICGRPELLFLDEPTVGLDVQARESLWRVLRELVHEGSSIVLTTHYLEEAEALANRVSVIAHGREVAAGTVDEIRAHVSRKHVYCRTALAVGTMRAWPEVEQLDEDAGRIHVITHDAEAVLRRLLQADAAVRDIEVRRAGLAEAFAQITNREETLQ